MSENTPKLPSHIRKEVIGNCILYQGDCLEILPLIDQVDCVLTDPPYSSGALHSSGRAAPTSQKYQSSENAGIYPEFLGDNRDQRSQLLWCSLWLSAALRKTRPGGLCMMFSDWRQLPISTDAVQVGGWIWRGITVWDKTQSVRPRKGGFRSQAEYVVWASKGPMNTPDRYAPGLFRHSVQSEKKHHIAGKPVRLAVDLLQLSTSGDTVLDPFMGSGTTGLACVELGRNFVGVELDPAYFEIACERMRKAIR